MRQAENRYPSVQQVEVLRCMQMRTEYRAADIARLYRARQKRLLDSHCMRQVLVRMQAKGLVTSRKVPGMRDKRSGWAAVWYTRHLRTVHILRFLDTFGTPEETWRLDEREGAEPCVY